MREWRFTWQEMKNIFAIFNSKKTNDLITFTEILAQRFNATEKEAEIIWQAFGVAQAYYLFLQNGLENENPID